jgi:hypothetical protein
VTEWTLVGVVTREVARRGIFDFPYQVFVDGSGDKVGSFHHSHKHMNQLFGDTLGVIRAATMETTAGVFVKGRFLTAVEIVVDGRGDLLVKFLAIHNILSGSSFSTSAIR